MYVVFYGKYQVVQVFCECIDIGCDVYFIDIFLFDGDGVDFVFFEKMVIEFFGVMVFKFDISNCICKVGVIWCIILEVWQVLYLIYLVGVQVFQLGFFLGVVNEFMKLYGLFDCLFNGKGMGVQVFEFVNIIVVWFRGCE